MDTNKGRILVVEDDKIDRMEFERFTRTESFPYEYVITGSIEDTKKVLESERFDAVVLDYFLGDGTAFELFNELKTTPIIIVTNAGSEEIAVNVMKAGAYDYLVKDPGGNYLKTLPLTIEIAIKRKQMENELQWYREHLEELVKEHTVELTKTNERLQQEIIERKRVEQELRLLAAMVEQSTDSIIRTDTEFRINYINEAAKELFGWSLDELRGKTPDIFNVDPRAAEIQTDIYTTVPSGKSHSGEVLNVRKDGSTFYCQFKVSPLFDENGKIYGYMGSQRDITKRKQAEVGLQQLEQAVEIMQSGITITDLFGKIIYTNLAEARMHGYQVKELLGKNVGILAPPELRKPVNLERIRNWKGLARESVNIRGDGTRFPVWLMSGIVKDAKGEPCAIVTSCEDITERKRAEEALRESEEKYRRVVEHANEAIIVVQDEMLKFFNSKTLDITGYSHTELISKPFVEFIHPDDREMVIERHSRRLQGEQVPDVYPFRIIGKGGNVRWVEIRAVLIDWEGKLAILTFLNDITEEKLAQEERVKLEKQLQQAQKMEAIGTLAGGIAHDFNNILGGIIGYTELTQDHIPENARSQYYLSQALKACKRAKELIIQILTFSRQSTSEKQPFQLNSIIKEALKLLRSTLPANIEIRYHAESDSSTILADPTQIHQVLMNLCTNAAYAMREKGGILEVDVREVDLNADNENEYPELEPGSYVKLSVNDTGHGMDHEILQRIFEPYFTTKAPDEGSGLGLSVTLGIVRDHGGVIKAQSAPGKGATFTVFFPMIESKLATEEEEYMSNPHGNERILFVDDEEFLVDTGQEILEQLRYKVVATMSSQEALELFRAQPDQFDLVITDQTMPKMTGAELAIKLMEIRLDIPIILCTGFSEVITEEQARALGIRAFVFKPISKKEMAQTIRKVLDDL